MNTDNVDLWTSIKEYFSNIWDATIDGSWKAKMFMAGAVVFVVNFYFSCIMIFAEFVEVLDLPSRTGVIPSTIENVTLAFMFWSAHKYLYTKAKEEL